MGAYTKYYGAPSTFSNRSSSVSGSYTLFIKEERVYRAKSNCTNTFSLANCTRGIISEGGHFAFNELIEINNFLLALDVLSGIYEIQQTFRDRTSYKLNATSMEELLGAMTFVSIVANGRVNSDVRFKNYLSAQNLFRKQNFIFNVPISVGILCSTFGSECSIVRYISCEGN